MLPAAEDVIAEDVIGEALPLFIGLERVFKLFVFEFSDVEPFIGVMLPGLLGVVIPALEALPGLLDVVIPALEELPLPGLLLRGTKSVADTVDEDGLIVLADASSTGAGTVVLWLLGLLFKSPMLCSAFPPAYAGRLLVVLHPVKKMPRLHAPIRPAKGILPIVLILPRVSPFTRRPNPCGSCHRPARLRRQCSLLP